jgi:nucleotide-binding universal stress UspA family protein
MIAFKQILVPVDFSETSDIALAYARALGESFGATLHVLHIVENPYLSMGPTEMYVPPPQTFLADLEKEARARLDAMLPAAERDGTRVVLRTGRPASEIIDYANAERIDLIVMGTHGRTALAHMLMGSVTEKVLRIAPCPVLAVRHPQHAPVLRRMTA